ncbi:MAG TPA: 50S ribosomal protein L21 [Thermoleophilaceae bacterium]|nr:50S ribosomal protein L21 [Thermoleophilaceae bacterium]
MYAIVRVGGKQYRVEKGDQLVVDRLSEDEGAKVALEPLLFRSDDTVFDADGLAKVKVEAVVRGHKRGEKLRIRKFKPKRGYSRRAGHRSEQTVLEIADIKMLARKPAAKKEKEADDGS